MRLKARLVGKGQNAGVQFRSQRMPNHFEMIGYQCDMGTMQGRPIWGALYDESRRRKFLAEAGCREAGAVLKPDDWNELVIRCEGPRIQIWVNGVQTVDYTEADAGDSAARPLWPANPRRRAGRSERTRTFGSSVLGGK